MKDPRVPSALHVQLPCSFFAHSLYPSCSRLTRMLPLKDRITLVTGSSRGIGKAIALALAEAGTDVAVNYHKHATAAESVAAEIKKLGRRCITVQADVSESAQVDRLFTDVEKTLAYVDLLVN